MPDSRRSLDPLEEPLDQCGNLPEHVPFLFPLASVRMNHEGALTIPLAVSPR